MTEGYNRVFLIGNLGARPELRITRGGLPVLNMSLATSRSVRDKNNVWGPRTDWHRVVVWGRYAESLAQFLDKGDRVYVEGRIETSRYEKNGEKRYSTCVTAIHVNLMKKMKR